MLVVWVTTVKSTQGLYLTICLEPPQARVVLKVEKSGTILIKIMPQSVTTDAARIVQRPQSRFFDLAAYSCLFHRFLEPKQDALRWLGRQF